MSDVTQWEFDEQRAMEQEITRLRAELADARAPDCRLCRHLGIASKPTGLEYECILAGTNAACADGHKYTGLIPVRLYEKGGK
jgi:hypothetical protein